MFFQRRKMIEIRKNDTLIIDGIKYYLFKNLKGSLLAINGQTKEMALIFNGLEENNLFISLKEGIKSLCPENIDKIFLRIYDENRYGNSKVLLLGRDGKKYIAVYTCCKVPSETDESLYEIDSITEVSEGDEVIFFAPGQHKIIPLGIKHTFVVKGLHII